MKNKFLQDLSLCAMTLAFSQILFLELWNRAPTWTDVWINLGIFLVLQFVILWRTSK